MAIDAAQRLRRLLLASDRIDELQCERFVHVLRERTVYVLGGTSIEPAAQFWMTPRRLRLIDDLIEARLDARLTVQDLAGALRLSAGPLARPSARHPMTISSIAGFHARERFCRMRHLI